MKLIKKIESFFFKKLEEKGIPISQDLRESIQERIQTISGYTPRIGVFGKTGVGKSSLCNALFGQEVCPISDIEACTRNPQEVLLTLGQDGQGIQLVDVPGVGEDSQHDQEYDALYKQLLPELYLVFWVFKADDRANTSDQDFYDRLIYPYIQVGKPFLAVINQVDKIEPFREWNEADRQPSIKQLANIQNKRDYIARLLKISVSKIIPVSANERYGLIDLVDAIVFELPETKKTIVLHNIETADDQRKESAANALAEAKKTVEDARLKKEEAYQKTLLNMQEEREAIEKVARESEERCRLAEEALEEEKRKAETIQQEHVVSDKARQESEHAIVAAVLDFVETLPVVGGSIKLFRHLFAKPS